jgi:branched-chain amino acid transport system permease protein
MTEALQIAVGGLIAGGVYALVAVGFTLIFSVSGVLNLAQGAFVVLGALTMDSFEQWLHWPVVAAFFGATAVAACVGAASERFAVRRGMQRLALSQLLMLTAGLLTVFEGAALVIWGSQPYAIPTFSGERPVVIAGVDVPAQGLWVLGATAVVVLLVWYALSRTTFGKALRACAETPAAASLMGIDVPRMMLLSFALAGAIGAVGGQVLGPITSMQFDSGTTFTNFGFIAVALGGMGSFFGAIAGGFLLGVVQQFAAGYVSSLFSNTVALLILLAVLIWRPNGILGGLRGRREDVRETPPPGGSDTPPLQGRPAWVICLLGGALVAVLPWLLRGSGLVGSLVITGILFLSVIGLDLVMGYAGQVVLGHAGFMAIGGYTAAILATRHGVSPLGATGAGIVLSLVVAWLLSLVTARLRGLYMALATLAFGLLVDSLTVGLSGLTGGPSGLVGIPSFSVGSYSFTSPTATYYLVWGLVAVGLGVAANLMRSSRGRAFLAVRADPVAARALGVHVPRIKTQAFLLSAAFASVAGSLYAFDFHFLSPDMVGTSVSLELVTMLVIGGEATLIGSVIGVALLTLLPAAIQALALWKTLAEGLLLMVILLYLPGGIFGALLNFLARGPGHVPRASAVREVA